ncbi:MAG: MarR family winged helix-turn-helix transcriptional regulator [Eubacteriales bacterium]|nr:MarR family winged helix-turn-helix transcriptional regulator [Eubacteriales bacterium]
MSKESLVSSFVATAGMHRRRARAHFAEVDISPGQPRILEYLEFHDGCIQRELATQCHLEPASITSVLCTMESKGYIRRVGVPGDKRAQQVWLTPSGWEQVKCCTEVYHQLSQECYAGFTDEEKQTLKDLLDRVRANMQRAERDEEEHRGE